MWAQGRDLQAESLMGWVGGWSDFAPCPAGARGNEVFEMGGFFEGERNGGFSGLHSGGAEQGKGQGGGRGGRNGPAQKKVNGGWCLRGGADAAHS